MYQKSLQTLEFDKICGQLKEHMVLPINQKRAEELLPFETMEEIQHALNETEQAQSLLLKRGEPPIAKVDEINLHIQRLMVSGILSQKELLDIAKLLKTARLLREYAKEDSFLPFYFSQLIPLRNLETEITSKILSEDEISDNASIKLYSIRKKIRSTNDKIKEILNSYLQKYAKYLQDPIISMRGERYVLPVKAEHKGEIPGIVHDSSASGQTLFVEPMAVVETNNALTGLYKEEAGEIERILYDLSNMAAIHSQEILSNYEIICALDFLFGKARYGTQMKGIKPLVNQNGRVDLKKARHPLIEKEKVVPIDIHLGKSFDTLIITGPNTGGKTVALKTLGLLCLMGMSGLLIPAFDKSEIACFHNICADIGDEQSISQSLSTFSSHMTNIVDILKTADADSLVLFDELGAGTDPVEGASLAIAIIEHLRRRGTKVIATTHYSEIKMYAMSTKGVKNASCEFDVETLRPTYKLLIGIPGKSNAFAISFKLGLPQEILDTAKEQLHEDNIRFEDVIAQVEKTRKELQKERELAGKFQREAEELRRSLSAEEEKNRKKHQQILEKAHEQAKNILEEAKEQSDEMIRELRKLRNEQSQKEFDRSISKAREKLNLGIKRETKQLYETSKKVRTQKVNPAKLLPGTAVRLIDIDKEASVLTKPDSKGNLTVMAGIMKINVHLDNLEIIPALSDKKEITYVSQKKQELRNKTMKTELDLRGQTVIDGVLEAEKYLDDAAMLHLSPVSIIHGKGTGALRSAIHAMLKNNRQVKSFRLGTFGEGETGVTIVELK